MNAPRPAQPAAFARYRTRLLLAMMLVVSAVTVAGLVFAQRNVAAAARRDFDREFQATLAAQRTASEVRRAMLAERCRTLARKPRIHAALEDGALDLLYPSARDELADVMAPAVESTGLALHARYYRFLDAKGEAIRPPNARDVGDLSSADEAQLALHAAPAQPQTGYLRRTTADDVHVLDEIAVTPIASSETGEPIAALVLGFEPVEFARAPADGSVLTGVWAGGELHVPRLTTEQRAALGVTLSQALGSGAETVGTISVETDGGPHLLFFKRLNPGSRFAPAYEVSLFSLADLAATQRQLLWRFAGVGAVLLLAAFGASRYLAERLAVPVEQLAVDSARTEAALETTSRELQRSARFSADASHQLKTPVTVLRAGLEELLADDQLSPETREELASLVHQTFRLTTVIEDLLLLSRMDAGRLRLKLAPVNLTQLIEAWLDDFGALPGDCEVETDIAPHLLIDGEKRYTSLIVQNLLENARKYNRPGGRIRISAHAADEWVSLSIANTGQPISPEAREHIFERFHRGAANENIPGHGLGLNLARELARLHGGELRLAEAREDWTEFEVRFRVAQRVGQLA